MNGGSDLDGWRGQLQPRGAPIDPLTIKLTLGQSTRGSSGSFEVRASDDQRWWVKPLNNLQVPRVPVNEYLIGRFAASIGAPTCEVALIEITTDHGGWEFRPGRYLEPGVACASRDVPGASEENSLGHRRNDDNQRRHAGIYAIYDWCHGADPQWLFQANDDQRAWSHDHGHYLPGGPDWTEASLLAAVDTANPWHESPTDLDPNAVEEFATRLEAFSDAVAMPILQSVPVTWPVSNGELETLGHFMVRRAPRVAERLRATIAMP